MNFTKGSNTRDLLPPPNMPHEVKEAGFQSARGFLLPRLSYQFRCIVCEGPLQRRNKTQKVCRKSQCRNAWRAKAGFGRYFPSTIVSSASKTPNSIGSKCAARQDRAWDQIAGPKLTASQLHCGLVGVVQAVAEADQKHRAGWRKHNAKALIHPPVNILGGYRFPDAPEVILHEEKRPGPCLTPVSKPDTNLDIPDFLKR